MEKENLVILVFVMVLILTLAGSMTYYYIKGPIENESSNENDSQLIGGCAGVHMIYWNECCERVALEKGIVKPACVGNWTVEDNVCEWECSSENECNTDEDCYPKGFVAGNCGLFYECDEGKCLMGSFSCPTDECTGLNESDCINKSDCAPQYIDNIFSKCAHVVY